MFHRHETANYTHINTHLLQLSNNLTQLPAHATQRRTSVSISSYYWATEESSTSCTLWYCYVLIVFFFFFFFLSLFLEKYKINTTMVLIVTARDTHNTRSIRIWWQREFFFSFLLSHSKRLRRSCEIGSLHHHATSWRQHSKRKVSSVSFDRSSISCAVESLVKPKFFL